MTCDVLAKPSTLWDELKYLDLDALSDETFKLVTWAPGYYDGNDTKPGDRFSVQFSDWIGFKQTWEITAIGEN